MAETGFDDWRAAPAAPGAFARAVNLAAAALSVALIAGLALWGYRLAVRDVTGVPVVRAMEGPMRIAPEDPGGDVAAHLGLAVNAVAAAGGAGAPADRLVLAPAPVGLAEEDVAGTLAVPTPPVSARAEGAVALALPPPAEIPSAPATQEEAIAAALAEALGQDPEVLARLAAQSTELAGALDAPDAATGAAAPAARAAGGLPRGATAGTLRPRPRPTALLASAEVPAAGPSVTAPAVPVPAVAAVPDAAGALPVVPAAAPAGAEIDPDQLPAGTRLVQLGAFESAELARNEWDRVVARFPELMAGKARVVQEAQSGGRAFWRLRAQGFDSETEARRFCALLLAEQTSCIPVTLR